MKGDAVIEHLLFSEEVKDTYGPTIRFDCPACKVQLASAQPYERMMRLRFLHAFPIIPERLAAKETWVICLQCRALLGTKLKLHDLLSKTPEELIGRIYFRPTFLQRALAIIALIVAIFPLIGFIVSLLALYVNWKTHAWPRRVSMIAIVVSVPLLIFSGVATILGALGVVK